MEGLFNSNQDLIELFLPMMTEALSTDKATQTLRSKYFLNLLKLRSSSALDTQRHPQKPRFDHTNTINHSHLDRNKFLLIFVITNM